MRDHAERDSVSIVNIFLLQVGLLPCYIARLHSASYRYVYRGSEMKAQVHVMKAAALRHTAKDPKDRYGARTAMDRMSDAAEHEVRPASGSPATERREGMPVCAGGCPRRRVEFREPDAA